MYCFGEINKALLPMKGHYFLWNAATAVVSFLPLYAKQLGFSSVAVGVLYTVMPLTVLFAKPLFGAVADKFRCRQVIFLVSQLIASLAFLVMILLNKAPDVRHVELTCNQTTGIASVCGLVDNGSSGLCNVTCPTTKNDEIVTVPIWSTMSLKLIHPTQSFTMNTRSRTKNSSCQQALSLSEPTRNVMCPKYNTSKICTIQCKSVENKSDTDDFYNYKEYWFLLCTNLLFFISYAVGVSVSDTICFQLLGDQPHKFGQQRLFGALGWGGFSIIHGLVLSAMRKDSEETNYVPIFITSTVLGLVSVLVSYQIKYRQEGLPPRSIVCNIFGLLRHARICIFVTYCLFVGMCIGLMWSFLLWYLEDLANAYPSDTIRSQISLIQGITIGVQCLVGEVPFFFVSSWILKRLGHIHVMNLVLLTIGVRLILYSLIENPWWAVPISVFNGPNFSLFYAGMASYASSVSPIGTETTVQGVVSAIFEGIGVSLGSFVSGILIDNYGGSRAFGLTGVASLVMCILHAVVQYFVKDVRPSSTNKDLEQFLPCFYIIIT